MPKLTIDGIEVEVDDGLTVLQACEIAGREIPRFCYHERLSVAGNCRMCLVEMERAPKPIASCAMPVGDGMVITTNSETIQKARKGVMEFLLINHPLDCPICDQGGECDLQDQAMSFGGDRSRYAEEKRAVKDKNLGPLVSTTMTRCIHCTRCIRFATEIAGVPELGATGRGEHMEVGTYVEKTLSSELSGNIIDLCPVGALTSKPYAFNARPWELKKTESIDVMDALGANISVDTRGAEVLRIVPRNNDDVNEEWISDKTRFACDGLRRQRLDQPYVRKDGNLQPASWEEAFAAIAEKVKGTSGNKIAALAGDQADCESMYALKELLSALGSSNIDCCQDGSSMGGERSSYLFNSGVNGIEEADAILIVGSNPRLESPVLNTRIRKRYLQGGVQIALIGEEADLTYKHDYLGAGPDTLGDVASGSNAFAQVLKDASHPMIIVGAGALARSDGDAVLGAARKIAEDTGMISGEWNGFNVLQNAASRVGGLDLGFVPGDGSVGTAEILSGAMDVVYLLGADEIPVAELANSFVVYQGHHGDAGAHQADVILPGAAYTEKNATYVNLEGRAQRTQLASFPVGEAKEDWAIIRALSQELGQTLPFDSLAELRAKMIAATPSLGNIDEVTPAEWGAFGSDGQMSSDAFVNPIENFFMTDPISRASSTMAACTSARVQSTRARTGTHG
ncbi:MAG: NADH-quinone oxidoreductase subunit G [Rhodospirillaceae bacterium]|jgi:NADH-quinone oxidoreductase subunit G|nr:NADH-quinone oxidoreductase subunit G [Rhodospirillaceae bacterium]MBT4589304.1 NADH-quinone oxidoreductase subunit G [Rhodospirillaceae bacterium]MBT5941601.1 NADH-quinone oxidoreductase subunit G [Rhodospirillaceae bacterium]MBT7267173.1 NADH-quinone oxidoreductase subunit G [Rhodospirillaceae bacterium]